jgi:hypothetical protein
MSFGDRHVHKRLGERMFDRAMRDLRFQALLARGFTVSFDYDIPYLGGYSRDGSTIYVDRDTPAEIQRGKQSYPVRPHGLVSGILIHEHWEKTAITAWDFDYEAAHELATHAEHRYAREQLRLEPDLYEALWRPIIRVAEKKLLGRPLLLPPDLDMMPYADLTVIRSGGATARLQVTTPGSADAMRS